MITDLERIGDQAVDIAEMSVYIKDKKQVFNLTHILEMADNASKMVTEAIDAFVKSDIEVAKKVARQDDIVDELFNRSKNETVELIHKNKELGSEALDIVMIAKYLERIADHAVNVAEWVAFSIILLNKREHSCMLLIFVLLNFTFLQKKSIIMADVPILI